MNGKENDSLPNHLFCYLWVDFSMYTSLGRLGNVTYVTFDQTIAMSKILITILYDQETL